MSREVQATAKDDIRVLRHFGGGSITVQAQQVVNDFDSRRDGMVPSWHKRPTGPGFWFCWREQQSGSLIQFGMLFKLTAEDIQRGSPFRTACVYGPIPEPPKEFLSETEVDATDVR